MEPGAVGERVPRNLFEGNVDAEHIKEIQKGKSQKLEKSASR